MTNREREFAKYGFEHAEGIENSKVIHLPSGREIRKTKRDTWEVQPWNDNYWKEFDDVLDAVKFSQKPKKKYLTVCNGQIDDTIIEADGYDDAISKVCMEEIGVNDSIDVVLVDDVIEAGFRLCAGLRGEPSEMDHLRVQWLRQLEGV